MRKFDKNTYANEETFAMKVLYTIKNFLDMNI